MHINLWNDILEKILNLYQNCKNLRRFMYIKIYFISFCINDFFKESHLLLSMFKIKCEKKNNLIYSQLVNKKLCCYFFVVLTHTSFDFKQKTCKYKIYLKKICQCMHVSRSMKFIFIYSLTRVARFWSTTRQHSTFSHDYNVLFLFHILCDHFSNSLSVCIHIVEKTLSDSHFRTKFQPIKSQNKNLKFKSKLIFIIKRWENSTDWKSFHLVYSLKRISSGNCTWKSTCVRCYILFFYGNCCFFVLKS